MKFSVPLSCVWRLFFFQATYYLNVHRFIEQELNRAKISFRKSDNAFLAVDDVAALQAAADKLNPAIIRERLLHSYPRAGVLRQGAQANKPFALPTKRSRPSSIARRRVTRRLPTVAPFLLNILRARI
jgi:hypothetical protein